MRKMDSFKLLRGDVSQILSEKDKQGSVFTKFVLRF